MHISNDDLESMLADAPPVNGEWRHRKSGNHYRIVEVCILENTLQSAIVYKSMENPALTWCRPLSEWLEKFEYLGDLG